MSNFYRFFLFCFFAFLLTGSQCTTLKISKSAVTSHSSPTAQANFTADTIEFHRLCQITRQHLFQDVRKAREYATRALKLSQRIKWDEGKLISYNLISSAYLLDGSYDVLRELANETFTLAKTTGLPVYTAHAKRFLGESYSEYREWDSAQINYDYAIKVFEKLGEDSARAVCLESLGSCFREKNDFEPAMMYYNQSYDIYDKLNSEWGKASVMQNKGFLYIRKYDHAMSIKLFNQALDIHQKSGNLYGQLHILNDLANAYNLDKQYRLAMDAAKKALELSHKYHSDQQTNWALESLSRAYRGQGQLEQAIQYLETVNYNKRRIYTERLERQFTMYQLMYENEQMGTTIQKKIIDDQRSVQRILIVISALILSFAAFLWFNNKKLRRKNAEIKEAMIQGQTLERKRVAAELHDHLGGTLASLNWYLHGIDKKVLSEEEQKIYQSVHQMVGSAYREVRSLSHNLMPAELEEHGLIMALNRLVDKLNDGKLIKFNFSHSGLEKRFSNQVEFELYSILLELTTNILKHSGASEANIKLLEKAKSIQLQISDNGHGMPAQTRDGMGLGNIKSRVQSLSGKIDIQNPEGKGTHIEIEIPKSMLG
jgi:signal transduction histidine kinase